MERIIRLFVFWMLLSSLSCLSLTVFAAEVKNSTTGNNALTAEQIRQAADSGDPDAQYALGYMYYYGKGGLQRNVVEAKRWIGKAAQNSQPQAIRAQKLMLAAEQRSNTHQVQPSNHVAMTTQSQPSPNMQTHQNYIAHNEAIQNHVKEINKFRPSQREKELEKEAAKEAQNYTAEETLVKTKPIAKHLTKDSDEKRLLTVPSHFYTVQLLAGENKDAVDRMMLKNDLQPKAAVYHTYRNAKLMYVLIYGQYKTKNEAKVAATQLQRKLKLEPWVKSYASVKKSISEQ